MTGAASLDTGAKLFSKVTTLCQLFEPPASFVCHGGDSIVHLDVLAASANKGKVGMAPVETSMCERNSCGFFTALKTVQAAQQERANAQTAAALVAAEKSTTSTTVPYKPEGRPKRQRQALIVDDSLVIRKSLGRLLQGQGFIVVTANDGLEGLAKLQETVFDVVFMDFYMPQLDGLDCTRQYRVWEESVPSRRPRVWIVGISAHASENDVSCGRDAGMDDFFEKPVPVNFIKALPQHPSLVAASERIDAWYATNVDADDSNKPREEAPPPAASELAENGDSFVESENDAHDRKRKLALLNMMEQVRRSNTTG